jgi:hypothetical protein
LILVALTKPWIEVNRPLYGLQPSPVTRNQRFVPSTQTLSVQQYIVTTAPLRMPPIRLEYGVGAAYALVTLVVVGGGAAAAGPAVAPRTPPHRATTTAAFFTRALTPCLRSLPVVPGVVVVIVESLLVRGR